MNARETNWWRDGHFLLAMLAGCVFWGALYAVTRPELRPSWPLAEPRAFVYPALLYPIVEELLFRGVIQDVLHRRWHGRLGALTHANLATSVLFSALHFFGHPPLWAVAVFVPSLVFGYFKDRSGRLGAPVALHVFYNSGYFWLFGAP